MEYPDVHVGSRRSSTRRRVSSHHHRYHHAAVLGEDVDMSYEVDMLMDHLILNYCWAHNNKCGIIGVGAVGGCFTWSRQ